ncbi:MAG: BrxA/BrxB family bacilliredoxin [Bacteroidota bacterium]
MQSTEEQVPILDEALTSMGFTLLQTKQQVDECIQRYASILAFVDAQCGCAGNAARECMAMALELSSKNPERLVTAMVGSEDEAVEQLWELSRPYPRTSPAIALIKDGIPILHLERYQIKSIPPEELAHELCHAMNTHC